jgi:hypothetical protein
VPFLCCNQESAIPKNALHRAGAEAVNDVDDDFYHCGFSLSSPHPQTTVKRGLFFPLMVKLALIEAAAIEKHDCANQKNRPVNAYHFGFSLSLLLVCKQCAFTIPLCQAGMASSQSKKPAAPSLPVFRSFLPISASQCGGTHCGISYTGG